VVRHRTYFAVLVFLLAISWSQAAQSGYQEGLVTRVEKKAHDRILYYLVNTPVMTEDPFYEISVRVNNTIYVGECPLRQSEDELPFDWKAGDIVRVLIDKAHMQIQRPAGGSLKMVIDRHFAVSTSNAVSSR